MGLLKSYIMIRYYVTIFAVFLCMSCNTNSNVTQRDVIKPSYVINTNLSLKDYSDIKGYSPSEGLVTTAEIAFKIAEPILVNIYGEDTIEGEKPFSINLENNIWMIEGSLEEGFKGGVAYMEIDKYTGEILKVIHTE